MSSSFSHPAGGGMSSIFGGPPDKANEKSSFIGLSQQGKKKQPMVGGKRVRDVMT